MFRPIFLFVTLVIGAHYGLRAQTIPHLLNMDFVVKDAYLPLNPLPDSLKTYHLVFATEVSERFSAISPSQVRNTFQVGQLRYSEAPSDAVLSVQALLPYRTARLHHRKDTTGRRVFRFEEIVSHPVVVQLLDASGRRIYLDTTAITQKYRTTEHVTEAQAEAAFNGRLEHPTYAALLREGYQKSVNKAAKMLRDRYASEDQILRLYLTKDMDTAAVAHLKAIREVLSTYNRSRSRPFIRTQLQPHIAALESARAMGSFNASDKKERYDFQAYSLSLANIYGFFGAYDQAISFLDPFIEADFSPAKKSVEQLVAARSRRQTEEYYQKTGHSLQTDQRKNVLMRLDTLKNQREVKGFVVLHSGDTISGIMLSLMDNVVDDVQVKFKYEKKLNAPIADAVFPLLNVREIHTASWHFAVIPYNVKFDLTEIIYQSPRIMYCRALPNPSSENTVDADEFEYFFVKKADKKTFSIFYDTSLDKLADYLDDCPKVAQRLNFGYYPTTQIQEAAALYDSLCGRDVVAASPSAPTSVPTLRRNGPPGVLIGFSSGANSYAGQLGASALVRITPHTYGRMAVGYGIWGAKFSAGLKYDFRRDLRFKPGWSMACGYTYNTGLNGPIRISSTASSTVGSSTNTNEVDVDVQQKPASTFYASTLFNYFFSKKWVFSAEVGYAQAFNKSPWTILPGGIGVDQAASSIKFYQPGGMLVALGIHFGL